MLLTWFQEGGIDEPSKLNYKAQFKTIFTASRKAKLRNFRMAGNPITRNSDKKTNEDCLNISATIWNNWIIKLFFVLIFLISENINQPKSYNIIT